MSISKYNKYFKQYDDTNKFKLGKTYKYSLEKSYIKLYYDNKRIVFQTPALFIPYTPRKHTYSGQNTHTLETSFFNEGIDSDLPSYEKWFYDLEKTVYKLLRKRSYLRANKTGFKTLFRPDEYRYTKKMNITFNENQTKFYILENVGEITRSRRMDLIDFPCYAFFIMELQTIWINKKVDIDNGGFSPNLPPDWGIKLVIHAIQCIPNHNTVSPFNNISFIPSKSFNQVKINDIKGGNIPPPPPPPGLLLPPPILIPSKPKIPEYLTKYFSMLKMGIPRDAVKHKMKMAGLNGDLLDKPHSDDITESSDTSTINEGFAKITAGMLNSVSLKKTVRETPEERKRRLAKEKAKSSGAGFEVSLDAVLSMRASLRKTGVDTKKRIEKDHYKQYIYENNLSDNED